MNDFLYFRINELSVVEVIFEIEVFLIGLPSPLPQRHFLPNHVMSVSRPPVMADFVIERLMLVACLMVDELVVG
jgi:hypothetical protein